jgi:reverse transcriptase-like protein
MRNSPRCRHPCVTTRIVHSRFDGTGFRKARASDGRSGFRRCETASCKPPCAWCWNRSSRWRFRRVVALLRAGYGYVVDADLQAYFDSIPHAPLRVRMQSKVSDSRVLALIDAFLQQPIFEGLAQWTVEEGTPQGAVVSPLLANLYLDPLDHAVAAAGFEMVRYADDFVILCRTADEAQQALTLVHRWTAAAGLRRSVDGLCISNTVTGPSVRSMRGFVCGCGPSCGSGDITVGVHAAGTFSAGRTRSLRRRACFP